MKRVFMNSINHIDVLGLGSVSVDFIGMAEDFLNFVVANT